MTVGVLAVTRLALGMGSGAPPPAEPPASSEPPVVVGQSKARVIAKGNPFAALGFPDSLSGVDLETSVMELELPDLTASSNLLLLNHASGHFRVESTVAQAEALKFDSAAHAYPFSDVRFGAVNTAYWIGRAVEAFTSVGFMRGHTMAVNVDAQCADMANAYYQPSTNEICLGHLFRSLGRDALNRAAGAAWDADVGVHEFGHAIFEHLHSLPPGASRIFTGRVNQAGAMNEGQADYTAYAVVGNVALAPWFFLGIKEYIRKFQPSAFPAVAHEKVLREVNNSLVFSEAHRNDEIHDLGRIFAGALYDLSQRIGVRETARLWWEAVPKVGESDGYAQHAQAILKSDQALNAGANAAAIREVFTKRGILAAAAESIAAVSLNAQVEAAVMAAAFGRCVTATVTASGLSAETAAITEILIPRERLPRGVRVPIENRVSLERAASAGIVFCADESARGESIPVILQSASGERAAVALQL